MVFVKDGDVGVFMFAFLDLHFLKKNLLTIPLYIFGKSLFHPPLFTPSIFTEPLLPSPLLLLFCVYDPLKLVGIACMKMGEVSYWRMGKCPPQKRTLHLQVATRER